MSRWQKEDDVGDIIVWQAPKQDAHAVPPLWLEGLPPAEVRLQKSTCDHLQKSTCDHLQKSTCGKHSYPAKRTRKYSWSARAKQLNTTVTARMRHLKIMYPDSGMDSVKEQHQTQKQLVPHPVHLKDFND